MANGWTPERRKRQSELVQNWKLWTKTTGPKTPEGKAKSSKNALKHGCRSREVLELTSLLAEQRRLLKRLIEPINQ